MLRILCGQPEAGNAKGKADAMVRLIRLHGVAPGKKKRKGLANSGIENHHRRWKFQRCGGGVPVRPGRLLQKAGRRDHAADFPHSLPQRGITGRSFGVQNFHEITL